MPVASRIGGEIPAFFDRFGDPRRWRRNWLAFSHGRSALGWLLDRIGARSALACAYTCPTVPEFLRSRGMRFGLFDIGASVGDIVSQACALPAPRMVLVPAMFGSPPWLDVRRLAESLSGTGCIVIDAAQTAFGHVEYAPPRGGAVLSCPRKTTALADGAVLHVAAGLGSSREVERLPAAVRAVGLKAAARALWASGDSALEAKALSCNRRAEKSWPREPRRMSDASRLALERLDRRWHTERRRKNRDALARRLGLVLPLWRADGGTPFCLPVFVDDPQRTLEALHRGRIFASALWPDAECDAARHPLAAWMARHLVSLPVDQRHDLDDMKRIAAAMTAAASAARNMPSGLQQFVTRRRARRRR
jgi:hypothetical protein